MTPPTPLRSAQYFDQLQKKEHNQETAKKKGIPVTAMIFFSLFPRLILVFFACYVSKKKTLHPAA